MLDAAIVKRREHFDVDVAITAGAGESVIVVGESGAGKTTLLRCLAGLERPERGHVRVADDVWFDAGRRIDLPAWRRSVGFVPQDYTLFPHLDVRANVAFGLVARGEDHAHRTTRVGAILEQFGIADLASARPHELSGGQQQRVALARALVLEPRLLLLDEPLSALDQATRLELRAGLRRLLARPGFTTVYVTHTPAEALTLGGTIVVLDRGGVAQMTDRDTMLRSPRSLHAAAFLGANLWTGDVIATHGAFADIAVPWGVCRAATGATPGDRVFVTIDADQFSIVGTSPGDGVNAFGGTVMEIMPESATRVRVRMSVDGVAPVTAVVDRSAIGQLALAEGDHAWCTFGPEAPRAYR